MGCRIKFNFLILSCLLILFVACGNQSRLTAASSQTSGEETSAEGITLDAASFTTGAVISYIKEDNSTGVYLVDNNMEATLQTLSDLGARVALFNAYDGDSSQSCNSDGDNLASNDTAGAYWCSFMEALQVAKEKFPDMIIGASFPEKHQADTHRFLNGSSVEDDAENRDLWLEGWIRAAGELGKLAIQYPNLKFWTIDDFSGYICYPGYELVGSTLYNACYSKDQVRQIVTAGKTCAGCDGNLSFYPVLYYQSLPRFLYPGFMIGANYWTQWHKDQDEAQAAFSFSLDKKPTTATLSFKHYDEDEVEAVISSLIVQILVNNVEVYSGGMLAGYDYFEKFSQDIQDYLCPGSSLVSCNDSSNTITVQMTSPDGNINVWHHKMLYVWDFKILVDGEEVTAAPSFNTSYATTTDYEGYQSLSVATNAGRILAASNENHLINDVLDGALVFVSSQYRSYLSDSEYAELLSETKEAFGDKILITGHYGQIWSDDMLASSQLQKDLSAAQAYADGALVWNAPLYLHDPHNGIFSQATSNKTTYDYDFLLQFPRRQTGIQGFYQKLTTSQPVSGTVLIKHCDSITDGSEYFKKRIFVTDANGAETEYYNDFLGADGGHACETYNSSGNPITTTLNLGSSPVFITLTLEEEAAVGDYGALAYFGASTPTGEELSDTSGNPVSWTFESGTTEASIENMYCSIRNSFLNFNGLTLTPSLLYDPDGDGTENCSP